MQRSLVFLLAATLGASACATDDDLGQVDVSLVGTAANGTIYRLRDAVLTIDGPGGQRVFHTEDDPNRAQINARLQSGGYTLSLATGWRLEKLVSGVGQPVAATLLSAHPLGFEVVAGEFTPVVLRFRAGADDVGLGEGDIGISIGVEEQIDAGTPAPLEIVATPAALSVPEGGSRTLAVHLSQPITSPAQVTVSSFPGAPISPGSLTFTPSNFSVDQTITVYASQDANAAHETGVLTLQVGGAPLRQVTVTLEDDDALSVEVGGDRVRVTEGSTAGAMVRLTAQPTGPITVQAVTDNPSVATVSPPSLVFTPSNWNTFQTFTVTALHDVDTVPGQTTLHVGAVGVPVMTSRPIEVDDDDAVSLVVTPSVLSMNEGSTQTALVQLSHLPPAPVTVNVTSSDTSRVTVAPPTTFTFDATNWDLPRALTISAAADADQQSQTARITLSTATLNPAFIDVTVVDTTVINTLGWPTTGGATVTLPQNELRVFRVQLTTQASLDRLQVIGGGAFTQARLAIYREVGNAPGPLVFGGPPLPLNGPGTPTVQPVSGIVLQPGAYYIGVVAGATVPLASPPPPQTSVTRCIQPMPFTGGFPTFTAAMCQAAQPLSVAAVVLQ